MCVLLNPVAVEAATARPVYDGRAWVAVSKRGLTYCQAPWFFGSSWHLCAHATVEQHLGAQVVERATAVGVYHTSSALG